MVDLPKKKVGIVACSGEELPEGTVTRLAALKVLEQLRPADTVTICLPLFLAGGEGDRAFARFYPTIAVDGCELRCAARGTEMYSGKPAASLVVSELVKQKGMEQPKGLRKLNKAGKQAVDMMAEQIADQVDQILGLQWDRRKGEFALPLVADNASTPSIQATVQATCSCGSGIPIQKVLIGGSKNNPDRSTGDAPAVQRSRQSPRNRNNHRAPGNAQNIQSCTDRRRSNLPRYVAERIFSVLREGAIQMSRTATYNTSVTWKGEHWGHIKFGNGPEMDFSAPPDAQGHPGVLTPEDAFVAAANTCIMMMFIWATERFKLNLISYDCRAEGTKLIELDRTEIFTHLRFYPIIHVASGDEIAQGN